MVSKKMRAFTKEMLQTAYIHEAERIAEYVGEDVYEVSSQNPDVFVYKREKQYIHRMIAEHVLRILKDNFIGISVTMDYVPDGNSHGFARYEFDWS